MPRGKPPFVLAADVGGTNLRCGLVSSRGKVLRWREQGSRDGETPAGMVKLLAASFRDLLAQHGWRGRVPPIAIAVAGGVDPSRGVVTQCPQFQLWKNFALGKRLSKELKTQVLVRNDVDCALLGEVWQGAARGAKSAMALWMGTGLGGALYLSGALWHGPSGMAGEFGHMPADPGGVPCKCGATGCLETLASGSAVERMAREAAEAGRPVRYKNAGPGQKLSARQVHEAARAGDPTARAIWARLGRALGESAGGLVNALSLDLLILGGKVSRAHRLFVPEMKKAMRRRAFKYPGARLQIRLGRLGDQAALLGAGAIAFGLGRERDS